MILTPLEAIVGIGMNAVSRRFEYQADQFACELGEKVKLVNPTEKTADMDDMGDRLGRALIQLHVKNLSTVWVDWLLVVFFLSFKWNLVRLITISQILCIPSFSPDVD